MRRRRLQPRAAEEAAARGARGVRVRAHRAYGAGLVRDEHGEGGGLATHGVEHLVMQVQRWGGGVQGREGRAGVKGGCSVRGGCRGEGGAGVMESSEGEGVRPSHMPMEAQLHGVQGVYDGGWVLRLVVVGGWRGWGSSGCGARARGGPHHGRQRPEHRRRHEGVAAARQQVEAEGDHVEERDLVRLRLRVRLRVRVRG